MKNPWFILYTKPRNEKKVASQLKDLGLIVYCPFVTELRRWSDRIKKIEVPLIPSCIFVQVEEKHRDIVFQISGVVRYLFWLGKPAIARDEEIETLKTWLKGEYVDTQVEHLKPGDKIAIAEGPFSGNEGLVQIIGKNNLQLLLLDLGVKITISKQKVA